MIYRINADIGEELCREAAFEYRDIGFFYEKRGDVFVETSLDKKTFRGLYGRAVCSHKSEYEGKMYVTRKEFDDPILFNYLKGIYRSEKALVLPESEVDYEIVQNDEQPEDEEEICCEFRGNPDMLFQELLIRQYKSVITKLEDEYLVTVSCPPYILNIILKRAECIEKSKKSGMFFVTEAEARYPRASFILRWKYRVNSIFFENQY